MNVLTVQWAASTYALLCCLPVTIRGLVGPSIPLCTVLHHLFTRIWNLVSPPTHDGALAISPTQWSLNLLKPVHKPPKPPSDPHNYRGIGLGDSLRMIYQLGLQQELLTYVTDNDLLTSAQGACQANRQPYDTVYTLTEFITTRQQTQRQPPFVFFGDIALVFPVVNREILLVRLHATGVPSSLWQHVRELHHTLKYLFSTDTLPTTPTSKYSRTSPRVVDCPHFSGVSILPTLSPPSDGTFLIPPYLPHMSSHL